MYASHGKYSHSGFLFKNNASITLVKIDGLIKVQLLVVHRFARLGISLSIGIVLCVSFSQYLDRSSIPWSRCRHRRFSAL